MIDFKKVKKKERENMSQDQRQRINLINKLKKENEFYFSKYILENRYNKVNYGEPIVEYNGDVKVYKEILFDNDLVSVADKFLISFGGFSVYWLDKKFIKNFSNVDFCIDAGNELFVPNYEMERIMNDVKLLSLPLVDDYNKKDDK